MGNCPIALIVLRSEQPIVNDVAQLIQFGCYNFVKSRFIAKFGYKLRALYKYEQFTSNRELAYRSQRLNYLKQRRQWIFKVDLVQDSDYRETLLSNLCQLKIHFPLSTLYKGYLDVSTFGFWNLNDIKSIHSLCFAFALASLRGFNCFVNTGVQYVISILTFEFRLESLSISHFLHERILS